MSDFKLLSTAELVALCKDLVTRRPQTEPDPDHEAWTSELKLTPRMVQDILDANSEI
jgi:hypothetical protein